MMNRPINVILLDDDADEILPDLKLSAKSNRVLIKESFKYSKDGINYIKKYHNNIDAIILDGFFLSDRNSSKKKNLHALKETVEELKKLLYKENLKIPYCVLTGYLEDLSHDTLLSDIEVFRKGEENKRMFDYLKREVAKNEVYQIKNEFDEVFELFDKNLLPTDKESDLVEILKKLKSKAKYNKDDSFTPIRKMYEKVIESLYQQTTKINASQDIIHRDLFNDDFELINIWGSHNYLSGNNVNDRNGKIQIVSRDVREWPEHIEDLSSMMLSTTQRNSHKTDPLNHFGYKSIVFALLEIILWYKNFIENYS